MSVLSSDVEIDYPESDGRPMGETDWHIEWTLRLRDMLKLRYRGQKVYVASDLLLYYHEGVPQDFVAPDGFVVLDCEQRPRRIFKTWEEHRVPNVVFEFTSASTRRTDEVLKPRTYAEIGVAEYFIFDPHAEYLKPSLQGHRLIAADHYERVTPDTQGRLPCLQLGLTLEISNADLLIRDALTEEPLLTAAEASDRAAKAVEKSVQVAQHEARAAMEYAAKLAERNSALEAEVERLRRELEQRH